GVWYQPGLRLAVLRGYEGGVRDLHAGRLDAAVLGVLPDIDLIGLTRAVLGIEEEYVIGLARLEHIAGAVEGILGPRLLVVVLAMGGDVVRRGGGPRGLLHV